ncbi:alpha-tocopherol transfer protein-like isoform X1 [Ixodes scapularis]|uniref:alpha-tocopherol transfer protein-like isoform X1 n=2 Tax=Ixodes scapularis TaxID=6945 RepID=UPI001A9F4212|nr:alpha-tocopherol transfer protein-like isoform X1 [Ixodes scapularis]
MKAITMVVRKIERRKTEVPKRTTRAGRAGDDEAIAGARRAESASSWTMERFSPDLMLTARQELGETPKVKRDAVAQLRTLLAEDLALKCPLDEEFLVKFLRCRKYRVKETLEVIRKYFHVRREYTDVYDNLLPSRILFDAIFRQNKLISILKQPDPQGRLIACCKLGVWNPDVCPLVEFLRAVVVSAEWTLLNQAFQIAGVVALVDMEELHLTHLLHYTPSEIRRVFKLVQECYPVRLRGIYVVNNPPVFQLLYALVKLVLKPKLQRRIHIIGRDYQKLHKLIPRERLPEEYDGTLEKYDYDDLERKLLSQENFFVELGSYGYQ